MTRGSIIGVDLNEKHCQISYYNKETQEPQTVEVSVDNYQIPLFLACKDHYWYYGKEAKRMATIREGKSVSDLLNMAMNQEKVKWGDVTYEAVWLLAKFVELSLSKFERISFLTFTVPKMTIDLEKMLKGIGQRMGLPRECVYVQDYRESFCHYMFYQPKELWQFESALFYCDDYEMRAYMLRKLNTGMKISKNTFVTVDEVAHAEMNELAAVYPVLNVEKAKEADARFRKFIESVFEKKLVSSVFLTGEGFENSWYPLSLKVLCNGRRAFLGNNLYSKGACYTSYQKVSDFLEGLVYLDGTKMTEQISIRMKVGGKEQWYPIVLWGSRWYESDNQWEVLLEEPEDIELHIESLASGDLDGMRIPLEGLPDRKNYSIRLQIQVLFLNEKTCKVTVKDIGFGEFFPATDFQIERIINLGGKNGQLNSLS